MSEDELKNNSLGILKSKVWVNILSIYHLIRNGKWKPSDIKHWSAIS